MHVHVQYKVRKWNESFLFGWLIKNNMWFTRISSKWYVIKSLDSCGNIPLWNNILKQSSFGRNIESDFSINLKCGEISQMNHNCCYKQQSINIDQHIHFESVCALCRIYLCFVKMNQKKKKTHFATNRILNLVFWQWCCHRAMLYIQ